MTNKSFFNKIQRYAPLALSTILSMAVLEAKTNPSFADDKYDPCWIHTDCEKPVGYSNDPNSSMGIGWYCTDGKLVTSSTELDSCEILKGCTAESGRSPQYVPKMSEGGQAAWRCADNAFIHTNCSAAGWSKDGGTMGIGWYCDDGKYVDKNTEFDKAYIHPGCPAVEYNKTFQAWICKN
ncbi:hypothetical protein [Synechococcus sp. UW179A]|uniref:hypothetical protein n=1 Tax=Synechococcus sp. UW179A TaxID=2575510 RepID=UPI0010BE3354|nr:hypothetical protein [Synechococcus sp. UW179A]